MIPGGGTGVDICFFSFLWGGLVLKILRDEGKKKEKGKGKGKGKRRGWKEMSQIL